jgi:hypothetical protein
MSIVNPAGQPGASQQAVVEAALLLERMGLSPADLAAVPRERPAVPTFAEYVPVLSAAVTAGRTARTGTGSSSSGPDGAWTSPPRRTSGS